VARFDIRAYYQSIDHRVMLAILSASGVSRDVFKVVQDGLTLPIRDCSGDPMHRAAGVGCVRGLVGPMEATW
jgi:hypothetical protein